MKIDLRNVYTQWINLDEKTDNAEYMTNLLDDLNFKNHKRFSAIRMSTDEPGTIPGEEHYPGIGRSQVECMKNIKGKGLPGLILEDDIGVSEFFNPVIEIPDDCDSFYLGTSHGDGKYVAKDVGDGICKISGMLAAHAILHVTDRYLNDLVDNSIKFMDTHKRPFDVYAYAIQPSYNVYSFHAPFFFQSDARNNTNKWETLTRTPLRVEKKFTIGTMG